MYKSIILTVALMTAPFVADAQWIANKNNFKRLTSTRVYLKIIQEELFAQ